MSVSLFAPEVGAVELIVLNTLTTPGELFQSAFLRSELRKYKPFEKYSRARFHRMMERVIERGLVEKVASSTKQTVCYKITNAGVKFRVSAMDFFKSL